MPKIDEAAKRWELDLSGRVGAAIRARRLALKWTAIDLADRTAELGYPVTRVSISKIETNKRAGKLDVAEVFVLAAALQIPPMLLMFPGFPDGALELLPNSVTDSVAAARWLSGQDPGERGLVHWVQERNRIDEDLITARRMADVELQPDDARDLALRLVKAREAQLPAVDKLINEAREQLWNTNEGESDG